MKGVCEDSPYPQISTNFLPPCEYFNSYPAKYSTRVKEIASEEK
jgi:hypothetical protein